MKKILIVTTIGGFLQQFEMNDIKLLLDQGYEIHYASNFDNPVYELDKKALEDMGIILHPICIRKSPVHMLQNMKALKRLCGIIKSHQIDVIHCHNPIGGVLARLAALFCGKKKIYVIYTAHGFHFYKGAPKANWMLFFPVEYLLAKLTDCLVTINREDYLRAKSFKTLKGKTVFQIPGVGVNIAKYADVPESKETIREELGIPKEAFYLLSVGELNHNKNHEVILRAIAQITDREIYYYICDRLKEEGYHQYEISNFAKPGFESKHNIIYWKAEEYLGLGLAAHSYFNDYRFSNVIDINRYISKLRDENKVTYLNGKKEKQTKEDKISEFMFLGLRMLDGINTDEFKEKFGMTIDEVYGPILSEMVEDKMLEREDNIIRLTRQGIDVSNVLFAEFMF